MPDLSRIAVSPNFTAAKLQNPTLEDKIDVFEDQVYGWILNHAEVLLSEHNPHYRHSGLAVLMIVGSYFESIASFIHGESSEGQSKRFFGVGFETVFPGVRDAAKEEDLNNAEQILSEFLATFYSELRCGLFHEAMVRGKIVIRAQSQAVGIIVDGGTHKLATIVIDPSRFFAEVKNHFRIYVAMLRDHQKASLRQAFEKAWDERLSRPGAVWPENWF